ncbi:MAG: glycosyltransferase family 2 protein [Candidatus Diapherotrites archaeon]
MPHNIKFSVLIPAFNEENAVSGVVVELKEIMQKVGNYEIIVVNDGSTDGTGKALKKVSGINVIEHESNRGYGASLKTGLRTAQGEWIIITDADGTYPNKEIPKLLKHIGKFDMVVGARTGENVQIPFMRKPAKWFLGLMANYVSGKKIPDLNSGLRVFRKKDAMQFYRMYPNGFSLTTTITLAYLTNGMGVKYIPINYFRREGKSKIHPIKDTVNFVSLIIRVGTYFKPLKIFIPVSVLLFIISIAIFLYSAFVLNRVMDITVTIIALSALQIVLFGLLADTIAKRG